MSMKQIRTNYGVPAKRGGRVEYAGGGKPVKGTITGSQNAHLRIKLDGDKFSLLFHPTWLISYIRPDGRRVEL